MEDNGRGSLSGVLTKGKIFEGDGTPVVRFVTLIPTCTFLQDAAAYSISYVKTTFTYMGYVLTAGFLWLFFHWFPHWRLKCTHKCSSFSEAHKILIKVWLLLVTTECDHFRIILGGISRRLW